MGEFIIPVRAAYAFHYSWRCAQSAIATSAPVSHRGEQGPVQNSGAVKEQQDRGGAVQEQQECKALHNGLRKSPPDGNNEMASKITTSETHKAIFL